MSGSCPGTPAQTNASVHSTDPADPPALTYPDLPARPIYLDYNPATAGEP